MPQRPFSDWGKLRSLVMLRGLGFEQREIAKKLGVSQSSVAYQLRKLRDQAKKEKVEAVWSRLFPSFEIRRIFSTTLDYHEATDKKTEKRRK